MRIERILFATGNEGKLREVREILQELDIPIVSMKEAGVRADIVEDGVSFEENAVIKARTVMELTGEVVLADDSGLVIDALDGEPGIHSARYLGEDTSYAVKNRAILERMRDVPEDERSARFVCAIAAVFPDGETLTVRETFEGRIGDAPRGENGFGYDPIFYLPDRDKSSAQLSPEEKNAISHRGKALRRMKGVLGEKLKQKTG